ncbi:MAG: DUF4149 domain-containing protein [Nitrospira sp.]|nr:DUF4149 domain-containing protein [Nitrospira sp.]
MSVMDAVMQYAHALAVAVLVGKVVLLSFVVAPILATQLEPDQFSAVVRRLFPAYYLLGMGAATLGLLSLIALGLVHGVNAWLLSTAGIWLVILLAESYCRTPLTPQSNAMRDRLKDQERQGAIDPVLQAAWNRLHQRSLYLNSLVLVGGLWLVGPMRHW